MKRVAAIDLGTNTFNLLIAEVDAGQIVQKIFAAEFPVKLGEGGINRALIAPDAFKRGLDTLQRITSIIREHEVIKVLAYATSAIRSARNGSDFMATVLKQTGIQIEPIDGNREAELIYKGIRAGIALNHPTLIMDIGGGSVELILCSSEKIFWKQSYPVGAARLRERYHQTDPVESNRIQDLYRYLDTILEDFPTACKRLAPVQLIGSAGAFETFDEILGQNNDRKNRSTPSSHFDKQQLMALLEMLIHSTKDQRERLPGLVAFRVDMIVMASALTKYIIDRTGLEDIFLSTYSLKEGMLMELLAGG